MCTSPLCPNDCRTVSRNARTRQRHMSRTYVRVYDAHRRQHLLPVGWWCPDCHAFMDDLRWTGMTGIIIMNCRAEQ